MLYVSVNIYIYVYLVPYTGMYARLPCIYSVVRTLGFPRQHTEHTRLPNTRLPYICSMLSTPGYPFTHIYVYCIYREAECAQQSCHVTQSVATHRIYTHVYIYSRSHISISPYIFICTHIYIYMYIHTCMHLHTHTHTYTYTVYTWKLWAPTRQNTDKTLQGGIEPQDVLSL